MKSFAGLLLLSQVLFAQSSAVPSPSTQSPQPRFLMADVHASPNAPRSAQNFGAVLRDGLYINRDATLLDLIQAAYGVPEDAVAGGPGWVASDRYDVIAKVPEGTTMASADLMLRALLAERFGLVVQNEAHPVPRYVLSVGKGSKLKQTSVSGEPGCQARQQAGGFNYMEPASQANFKLSCHNQTADGIANLLHAVGGGYVDHDVVNSTKLEGSWDFDLEWTSANALTAKGPDGISLFDAVDKQLGLKLQLQNIPIQSLTISKLSRKPSPNASNIASALALPAARFEVAAIKAADPKGRPFTGLSYSGGTQLRAGGTLRALIGLTLQVSPSIAADTVIGLPKSADTQSWDIVAKLPSTGEGSLYSVDGRLRLPPISVLLEMLRGMLADQFELKTHTENREITVYALTVIGQPKMQRADEAERTLCKTDPTAPRPEPTAQTLIRCKNGSMDDLARILEQIAQAYIDHPIVNETGLEGGWDLLVGFTPKAMLLPPQPAGPNAAMAEASTPGGTTLFEALERQLGLKLVKEKRSIPVVVVDHVDETPLN